MKNFNLLSLFLLSIVLSAPWLNAQALDPSFNGTGVVVHPGPGDNDGEAVVLAPDGKIVVASASNNGSQVGFLLIRYDSSGVLDTGFGANGSVLDTLNGASAFYTDVAVQGDGKIVSVGYSSERDSFYVFRHTVSGEKDTSFAQTGLATTSFGMPFQGATSVALDGNKIVVAGVAGDTANFSLALARYLPDGSLDPSFGNGGLVLSAFAVDEEAQPQILVRADGKIVVATTAKPGNDKDFLVARLENNGSGDQGFGSGGVVTINLGADEEVTSITEDLQGRVLIAGTSTDTLMKFAAVRMQNSGVLDSAFAANGIFVSALGVADAYCNGVAVGPDSLIYLAGDLNDGTQSVLALLKLDSSGTPFPGSPLTTTVGAYEDLCNDMVLQPDGRIILVGESDNSQQNSDVIIARYLPVSVGLAEAEPKPEISIFPNPVAGDLTVRLRLQQSEVLKWTLLNPEGKTVKDWGSSRGQGGWMQKQMDLGDLAAGLYFLRIEGGSFFQVRRILKM